MSGWLRPSLALIAAIVCGVGFFPASSRAGSCGATKNNKNVATVTNHITMMPSSSRRMRKVRKAMSAHLGGRGSGPGPLGDRAPALSLAGEQTLGARVHGVPDAVAEQVERERGEQQESGREDQVPPGGLVERLGLGEQVAPARGRRLDAHPEVGEGGLEHDRGGNGQRGQDK